MTYNDFNYYASFGIANSTGFVSYRVSRVLLMTLITLFFITALKFLFMFPYQLLMALAMLYYYSIVAVMIISIAAVYILMIIVHFNHNLYFL